MKAIKFILKAIGGALLGRVFIELCHSYEWYPEKLLAEAIVDSPSPDSTRAVLWGLALLIGVLLLFVEFWIRRSPLSFIKVQLPWGISWDFTGNFVSLSSQRQSIGKSGDMMLYGDIEYRINQFQVKGKNNSKRPIEDISGYIRSDKTNKTIPILLESFPPEETHGIPGKCEFWVRAIFPKSTLDREGYTIDDFWRHFGEFTFVFEYGTKKYEKTFSKRSIEHLIEKLKQEAKNGLIPKEAPRVVPRNNDDESRTQNDHVVVHRDWNIREALEWWEQVTGFKKEDKDVLDFFSTLRQVARDGDITIWGRANSEHRSPSEYTEPLQEIPKEHWNGSDFDCMRYVYAENEDMIRDAATPPGKDTVAIGTRYVDLRITSTEIKKISSLKK